MTLQNKRGFTLIELLVVVLIIAVLAAVALPQYQKAIDRARMAEAVEAVENIAHANDLYYLAHDNYTHDINELDSGYDYLPDTIYCHIKAKQAQYFRLMASNNSGEQYLKALVQRERAGTKYALSTRFSGTRICNTYSNASAYEIKLCQAWAQGKF